MTAAPGFEHISRRGGEHGEAEHGEIVAAENGSGADNLFLFRIGVGYAFEIGARYATTPGIAYDWVN